MYSHLLFYFSCPLKLVTGIIIVQSNKSVFIKIILNKNVLMAVIVKMKVLSIVTKIFWTQIVDNFKISNYFYLLYKRAFVFLLLFWINNSSSHSVHLWILCPLCQIPRCNLTFIIIIKCIFSTAVFTNLLYFPCWFFQHGKYSQHGSLLILDS